MTLVTQMTKPILLALFVSLALNGLFGYLSYSFYSDKAVAESQLEVAIVSNKFMALSLERKDKACTLQDKIAAENQAEQQEIVEEKDADLNAIDKMASVSVVEEKAFKGAENVNKQSNVVSLDTELPESLRLLLQDSCNRSKGSACTNP
jgi:hypothetical protein